MPTFTQDFPEFRNMDSGNESVNRIRRNYATKDAERARAARRRMQEGAHLTAEAQNDGQAREWEARRQARATRRREHAGSRELIDARGSIDSRAFNERREIVGYTIDERDRHEPMLDSPESPSRWRSQSPEGYSVSRQRISSGQRGRGPAPRPTQIGLQGGPMGSRRDFAAGNQGGVPLFVKVAIPVIIVLALILFFLLTP